MLLFFLIFIGFFQVFLYHISDLRKFKYGRTLVFIGVLAGHFYFFPDMFIPEPQPDEVNCAMPALGVILVFWVLGVGSAIIIHLIYFFVKKKYKGKKESLVVPSDLVE